MNFLEFVSLVFGWAYTLCWSGSFYPQPILNFRRKTTAGTTVDFPLLNTLGFLAYLASTAAFLYSPLIRVQYAARHHGLTPTVQFNDLAFALHALVLCFVIASQYVPGLWFARHRGMRPSRFILGILAGCVVGVVFVVALVAGADGNAAGTWAWLDVAYALGYVKLVVTLVKYSPQVVANYSNRSTKGWSIGGILLDFAGGLLSLAQLAIDSYLQRDWSGVTGNPVKFALANVSMMYDVVFMVQHYVLYRSPPLAPPKPGRRGSGGQERGGERLLEEERRDGDRRLD